MYVDAQQLFSDSQALVGTAVSTNVYNSQSDRDIGIGKALAIVVAVKVSPVGGGTLEVQLQTDDNVGMASPTVIASTGAVAAALLTAGQKIVLNIPGDRRAEQYFRLNYVMVTMTAITVTAFITSLDMVQNESYYPDAINIG